MRRKCCCGSRCQFPVMSRPVAPFDSPIAIKATIDVLGEFTLLRSGIWPHPIPFAPNNNFCCYAWCGTYNYAVGGKYPNGTINMALIAYPYKDNPGTPSVGLTLVIAPPTITAPNTCGSGTAHAPVNPDWCDPADVLNDWNGPTIPAGMGVIESIWGPLVTARYTSFEADGLGNFNVSQGYQQGGGAGGGYQPYWFFGGTACSGFAFVTINYKLTPIFA